MPTGYTAGILNGETKTFEQFAILCIRAFGAAIHMRDESLDTKYTPRKLNEYYIESVEESKKDLQDFLLKSDDEILSNELKEIEEKRKYYEEKIVETKKNLKQLKSILKSVKNWEPPTTDHFEFKNFMIEQLESTIKWDGDYQYYIDEVKRLDERKEKLNIDTLKQEQIESLHNDIAYSEKRLQEELQSINNSNQWVETLLTSLLENRKNKKLLK